MSTFMFNNKQNEYGNTLSEFNNYILYILNSIETLLKGLILRTFYLAN